MSVDITHLLIDIENQKQYNSCVGQSLSTYLEAIWRKFDPDHAQEFSPAFIWALAKGEKVDQNKGVIPAVAFANMQKHGVCLERTFPYTDQNMTVMPPAEAMQEAKQYRISGWKSIQLGEIKSYLDKGLPVSCLMDFGGGHQVCVFGYDETHWLIVNSWGTGWMNAGVYWMPDDEFKKKFRSAYVITGIKGQWLKDAKKWFSSLFK